MEVDFMTADTALPPCMPLPRAMLRLPISSTAKVMYARMLDIVFLSGIEDENGILFIHFPIVELAAALARSTMTVKRSLNELEDAGLMSNGFLLGRCQLQELFTSSHAPRGRLSSPFASIPNGRCGFGKVFGNIFEIFQKYFLAGGFWRIFRPCRVRFNA